MLREPTALTPPQRLASLAVLHKLHADLPHPAEAPFAPVLASVVCSATLPPWERWFCAEALVGRAQPVCLPPPISAHLQLLAMTAAGMISRFSSSPPSDLKSALREHTMRWQPLVSGDVRPLNHPVGVSPVLLDSGHWRASSFDPSDHELTLHSFRPLLIRPVPPMLPPSQEELRWLLPALDRPVVIWDARMCDDAGRVAEFSSLLERACMTPMVTATQQVVRTMIQSDPTLISHSGLTPKLLPGLVENNPVIATDILAVLMSGPEREQYLDVLIGMVMSLHSMEVVNRLTTLVELPADFIHLYIRNCIQSCENIQDKYMQHRLVRLVCVFLQSLIRNHIVNVRDVFIEVQAFCIEFPRIREAAALFRLLRQM